MESSAFQNATNQAGFSKPKLPIGIILILVWMAIGFISTFYAYTMPVGIYFGVVMKGVPIIFIHLMNQIVTGFAMWGLYKRRYWGRNLTLCLFLYYALMQIVAGLYFVISRDEYIRKIMEIMSSDLDWGTLNSSSIGNIAALSVLFGIMFQLGVSSAIALYLILKRKYFLRKEQLPSTKGNI